MVYNPGRSGGGDVGGTTKTVSPNGKPAEVAKASYDPGYPLGKSMDGKPESDLKRGFCSEGY